MTDIDEAIAFEQAIALMRWYAFGPLDEMPQYRLTRNYAATIARYVNRTEAFFHDWMHPTAPVPVAPRPGGGDRPVVLDTISHAAHQGYDETLLAPMRVVVMSEISDGLAIADHLEVVASGLRSAELNARAMQAQIIVSMMRGY